ncbi:MAG: DinB family protein [bacterium]|nr:DinB family protein [bacterium]
MLARENREDLGHGVDRRRLPLDLPRAVRRRTAPRRREKTRVAAKNTGQREFPRDYWPAGAGNASSWERSIQQFRADHARVVALVEGDLLRPIPSAPEHTVLRDLLVLADHTAYHLGQMTLVRKLMGNW